MNDLTLEQEFERCKNAHMISICMSSIMYDLECEAKEKVNLPTFLLKDQMEKSAMKIISTWVANGEFKELYDICWNNLEQVAPNLLR